MAHIAVCLAEVLASILGGSQAMAVLIQARGRRWSRACDRVAFRGVGQYRSSQDIFARGGSWVHPSPARAADQLESRTNAFSEDVDGPEERCDQYADETHEPFQDRDHVCGRG